MRVLYAVGAPRIALGEHSRTPGPRAHVLGVVGAFRRHGHEVETYLASEHPWMTRLAGTEEGDIQGSRVRLLVGDFLRIIAGLINQISITRKDYAVPPDIVYERYATYAGLGRRLQKRGCFWVVESNGLFYEEATGSRRSVFSKALAKRSELRTYRDADLVVTVTERIREQILRQTKIAPRKIVVVPNGIEPDSVPISDFSNARRTSNSCVIGFVGQVVEWQGLEELIKLLPDLPRSVTLCIVGDGPQLVTLKALVDDLQLRDRVVFTGRVSKDAAAEMLRRFDIGYAGHRSWGNAETYHSPLKVYEYCGAGLALVATRSEASTELMPDFPIFEFRPGDPEDLRRAIELAIAGVPSDEEREVLSARARDRLSWTARTAGLIAVIAQAKREKGC